MKYALMIVCGLLAGGVTLAQEVARVAAVELHRSGGAELPADARAKVAQWAVEFLKTSQFSSAARANVTNASVSTVHQNYRQALAKDHLVVTFAQPSTVKTMGGDVQFVEIIVGLDRGDQFPGSLYTVDPEGRVVSHAKYGSFLPAELLPVGGAARQTPTTQEFGEQTRHDLSWTHFSWVRPSTTLDEIYGRVGKPARDIGSGLHILEYVMVGGDRLYIGSTGDSVAYIRRGSITGTDILKREE